MLEGFFRGDFSRRFFQGGRIRQGFALLALIPIWLYRGRQGLHSRGFKLFCYAFYPGHMLVLALLQSFLL